FAGERHLTSKQIRTLQRWASAGAPPGDLSRLPRPPSFPEGWFLGKPDLVISMPVPFELPAEGRDVYRNFVVPIPLEQRKFVRAVELKAANPRVVHHAFLFIDSTGDARRLDLKDERPGFDGMNPGRGAGSPGGHFLSWQPGTVPTPEPVGTQWELQPHNDAVLQMHMRPSGKPESVTAEIGFYFTEAPPTRFPLRLLLRSTAIDIPPGERNYVIESSYRLPVAIQILAVLPHAHYLGHRLEAWADLPDGSRKMILNIPEWDFDWQDHYQFAQPLSLPKGAMLRMRYSYDNSASNPHNADTDLRRVQFGEQTSDEMGELWLQVLTTNPAERPVLEADYMRNWAIPDTIARARVLLERNPDDAETRANLGAVLVMTGQLDAALAELKRALQSDPDSARAHSHLGQIYLQRQDATAARREFEKVLALDPDDFKARNNLGYILLVTGDPSAAAAHFERVLAQHPEEALARKNLERARAMIRTK
ncbi:MAG TPA: tetratricopeptide repeat protein, partial [Chthoniobacteraceae bacterium]|nr:tetratricopeptide repeat protein [Chthoniobacteraceae bacterium]